MRHAVLAGLSLTLFAHAAFAMEQGHIGDPKLLSVRHEILVFEYDTPQSTSFGWELAQLIAQQSLGTIEGLTSVGVVSLHQPAHRVALTRAEIERNARTQGASVVVWGECYEAGDMVFVYSHVRLVALEGASFGVQANVGGQAIRADPPTDQVDFAPVSLRKASLASLREAYERSVTLRAEPRETAASLASIQFREPYGIAEIRGDWMKVQGGSGRSGWVQHKALESAPDLAAVQGVVLYAQAALQIAGGANTAAQKTLRLYLAKFAPAQDTMNRALAHVLLGTGLLRAGTASAAKEFSLAADLVPSSPAPANYLAVARFPSAGATPSSRVEMQDTERRLIEAVRATSDRTAARNLAALYRLAMKQPLLWDTKSPSARREASAKANVAFLERLGAQL